jgi:hypothetical protein
METMALSQEYNMPLFVFGNTSEKIKSIIAQSEQIKYFGYMNGEEMLHELSLLVQEYFLFGVSLINPIHHSYTIQIANKEIDYVSLGIPLLGNRREPTKVIIDAGCGVFYEAFNNQVEDKQALHNNCLVYAKENLSNQLYREKLLEVFDAL